MISIVANVTNATVNFSICLDLEGVANLSQLRFVVTDGSGNWQNVTSNLDNTLLCGTTNHLSYYAVIQAPSAGPIGPGPIPGYEPLILVAAMFLALVPVMILRKRRQITMQ